jgi:putative methanogenesis marker protein 8
MSVKGVHEIYCCGARVRISEKGIEVLSEPLITYCPLHEALYGTKKIDIDAIRKTVEMKVAGFGFCCANRLFDAESVVAYGASEMMRVWLERKLVDCAVVVCEGAGTVITANGRLVQAIGARLTGIIKTTPIKEIMAYIEEKGGTILDKATAQIDQVEGVKRAFKLGFKRIAVSVAGFQAKAISKIRNLNGSESRNPHFFCLQHMRERRRRKTHSQGGYCMCKRFENPSKRNWHQSPTTIGRYNTSLRINRKRQKSCLGLFSRV